MWPRGSSTAPCPPLFVNIVIDWPMEFKLNTNTIKEVYFFQEQKKFVQGTTFDPYIFYLFFQKTFSKFSKTFFFKHFWIAPIFFCFTIQKNWTKFVPWTNLFFPEKKVLVKKNFWPLRYVLWCCGGICHQVFTFFQISCGRTVYPIQGVLSICFDLTLKYLCVSSDQTF